MASHPRFGGELLAAAASSRPAGAAGGATVQARVLRQASISYVLSYVLFSWWACDRYGSGNRGPLDGNSSYVLTHFDPS